MITSEHKFFLSINSVYLRSTRSLKFTNLSNGEISKLQIESNVSVIELYKADVYHAGASLCELLESHTVPSLQWWLLC